MNTISIASIEGLKIGQAQDEVAGTGATVLLCESGMAAGVDVRGGGPASRDTRVLDPLAAAEAIHAVLLTGGSAFGLDAAGGVMRYLEERGIGVDVGGIHVPLVCQSALFDLAVGDGTVRPDAAMAYAACQAAEGKGNYRDGNYGAGCGASVGKLAGMNRAMKTGIGSHAVQAGALKVGAVVAVNAVGDVVDPATGTYVAGLLDDEKTSVVGTTRALVEAYEAGAFAQAQPGGNTAIGAIVTNAALPKALLCKVAGMGHDGLARATTPVHTSMDGDTLYALSVGQVHAPLDVVGTLAAECVAAAVVCAARSATGAYGLPAACDLGW